MLDASVIVKLVTREPGSPEAAMRVAAEADRIAPDWAIPEVANALSRKARNDGLPANLARRAIASVSAIVTELVDTPKLMDAAFRLSMELDHPLYDCFYLALALDRRCPLLTSDIKFVAACRASSHADVIERLAF